MIIYLYFYFIVFCNSSLLLFCLIISFMISFSYLYNTIFYFPFFRLPFSYYFFFFRVFRALSEGELLATNLTRREVSRLQKWYQIERLRRNRERRRRWVKFIRLYSISFYLIQLTIWSLSILGLYYVLIFLITVFFKIICLSYPHLF